MLMNMEYTAVVKQDSDWRIGWIEEIPGVNCQERTKAKLLASLREERSLPKRSSSTFRKALNAAGEQFVEKWV